MTPMFRYFLGFQVPADRAGWLARQSPPVAGDLFAGLKPQNYHLTLCTIDETAAPHPFLRQRVAKAKLTAEIIAAINRWEPRVTVTQVIFDGDGMDGILRPKVRLRINGT